MSEARVVLRAGISSLVATLVDGAFYQGVVASASSRYVAAAAVGAIAGAVTNFSLNRWWAFRATETPVVSQGVRYVVGSALTLLVLQLVLWVLVDRFKLDPRMSWLPAKVLTWLAFSYPFQRVLVFAEPQP